MSTERIQMDIADQAEFGHFRDYLTRIFRKYGPDVLADAFTELASKGAQHATSDPREQQCSFCGTRQSEIGDRILAGPGVFVCIRCIDRLHAVRMNQWTDEK